MSQKKQNTLLLLTTSEDFNFCGDTIFTKFYCEQSYSQKLF